VVVPSASEEHPAVWYANVGGDVTTPIEWFIDVVAEFVDRVARSFEDGPPPSSPAGSAGRSPAIPRRVAVPLVGAGEGGAGLNRGGLIDKIVRRLVELSDERKVDIVLVLFGDVPYSAAQRARRELEAEMGREALWQFQRSDVTELTAVAEHLAEQARAYHLVLFIGAGVSAGAGVPTWKKLLRETALLLGRDSGEIDQIVRRDLRDAASLLEALGPKDGAVDLRSAVAEVIDRTKHYSVAHGLLASLPSCEAVTTNFDTLFERAARSCDRPLAVLPSHPLTSNGRWLLKLHGTVDAPRRMVLTRPDYLEMPRQYGALMGLVQAMLLMRHMLFVGYSLSDEDLHELLYEVRMARRGDEGEEPTTEPFATVLTLFPDPLADALWNGQLRTCAMFDDEDGDLREAARELEKFLDFVAFLSSSQAPYLLDPTFDALLTDDDQNLKEALTALGAATIASEAAHERIVGFLREFGWQGDVD